MLQSPAIPVTWFHFVRLLGGVLAAFSLVMGLLIVFVIPGGCSFVGGIQLFMLGFLFIIGLLCFFLGQALVWSKRAKS